MKAAARSRTSQRGPRQAQRNRESPHCPEGAGHQDHAQPAQGCSWRLLWDGSHLRRSPTLSPHVSVSKERLLTLQEPLVCPWPGLECPPASFRKAFGLRTGSESPASTKHLQALTACCWAALPPKRLCKPPFSAGCFTCL